ncbi:MAG: DUF1285 domain-containing protein [Porticoccaceae bacterium]|nr:DUF1285 domain-containing protein [Pseudomonadales bacterium]MCP5171659.1 DUF1285 domain-containing protein [Pseudomonadales bacterium]
MKTAKDAFQRLVDELTAGELPVKSLPPVEAWTPPLSGRMDLVIRRDGSWVHEGSVFQRQPLVKLFASILKREGDDYFLVTPVEKWQITVEDAPLLVTSCQIDSYQGNQSIVMTTFTDDIVLVSEKNPIRVVINRQSNEPSPYLLVRRNLEAKISRSVYYQLSELATEVSVEGEQRYSVTSMGCEFLIG